MHILMTYCEKNFKFWYQMWFYHTENCVYNALCKGMSRVRQSLHQTISTSKWSHVITTVQTQYFIRCRHLALFVTLVLLPFCNGQIDFVKKFIWSFYDPHSCNMVWWLKSTCYTMFSWTISICVMCECYGYIWLLIHTQILIHPLLTVLLQN